MSNKYDNIDFCLNLLDDYINREGCYDIGNISKDDVELIDIKKRSDFNYSDVLKAKFKYHGKVKGDLLFVRESNKHDALVKICAYDKSNQNYSNMKRPELVGMKNNFLLSMATLEDRKSPILLPVMNFDINLSDISKINKDLHEMVKKNGLSDGQLYVRVYECFHKIMTLKEYLDKNIDSMTKDHWRYILFYVFYGLHKISNKYPKFRHNALDIESVYLYLVNKKNKTDTIRIRDDIFDLPNINVSVKISNFNNSTLGNSKSENPYYDIHHIMQSIFNYFKKNNKFPDYLRALFDEILPKKFRIKDETNIGLDEDFYKAEVIDVIIPINILTKNNFFAHFIRKSMSSDTSPLSTNYYNIRDYGIENSSVNYDLSPSASESPLSVNKKHVKKSNKKSGKNSISGYRKLANLSKGNSISEYTYTETPSAKEEYLDSVTSEMQDTIKRSNYDSFGLPDKLSADTIASPDGSYQEEQQNAFYKLFGEKVQARKNKKYKGHAVNPQGGIQGQILKGLPEGFSGRLPDHLQDKMGNPGMSGQSQMPMQMPMQMPPMQGMMPPMQGMPPQGAMPPQMPPMQGMMPQQQEIPPEMGYPSLSLTSQMQNSIVPNNSQSIHTIMSPANTASAGLTDNSYNNSVAHTSLLPPNMMMSHDSNANMSMNNLGSASLNIPNLPQSGGSKKKFFFSKGEERR